MERQIIKSNFTQIKHFFMIFHMYKFFFYINNKILFVHILIIVMHTNINIIKIYSNNIFYDNINIDNILLTYTMIIFGINNTINI